MLEHVLPTTNQPRKSQKPKPTTDSGLAFDDIGDDSSDSGIDHILGSTILTIRMQRGDFAHVRDEKKVAFTSCLSLESLSFNFNSHLDQFGCCEC